jgi:biotin synthase-related radical SAM superfamily protein
MFVFELRALPCPSNHPVVNIKRMTNVPGRKPYNLHTYAKTLKACKHNLGTTT